MQKLTKFKVIFDLFTVCVYFTQQQNCELYYIYLNAKVSQPFNICIFFSMVHVRILILSYFMLLHNAE